MFAVEAQGARSTIIFSDECLSQRPKVRSTIIFADLRRTMSNLIMNIYLNILAIFLDGIRYSGALHL